MALKQDIKLNSDFIFSHVSEEQIWAAYHGDVEFGTIESSRFRTDYNPSCGFYVNKSGKIIYNDIATSEKLDCFAYIAKLNKETYKDALRRVALDFGIIEGGEKKFDKSKLAKIDKVIEEKIIEVEPDVWSKSYLDYWAQFHITKEELEREEVIPIKELKINGEVIPNYIKNIRFAYVIRWKDKKYYKIYSPYAERGKYRWLSNVPIYLPFGMSSLPYIDNRLIISKSQKERLIFLKYFDDVIGLQNESKSALRDSTIAYLKSKYKYLYLFMDNDGAGEEAAEYFKGKGLIPLLLLKNTKGAKDWAEFINLYGQNKFEQYLKYYKLI